MIKINLCLCFDENARLKAFICDLWSSYVVAALEVSFLAYMYICVGSTTSKGAARSLSRFGLGLSSGHG